MISEYLKRDFVLGKARFQRDLLVKLAADFRAGNPGAIQQLNGRHLTVEQVEDLAAAITEAVLREESAQKPPGETAYIPSSAVLCALQAGWTQEANERKIVQARQTVSPENVPSAATDEPEDFTPNAMPAAVGSTAPEAEDASAPLKLGPPVVSNLSSGVNDDLAPALQPEALSVGDYIESSDVFYGLDGIWSKVTRLFRRARPFNREASRTASSTKPMRLYLFGDWGTGLPLARRVTGKITEQIGFSDESHQQHVVHLGDVYYVGDPGEYENNMLAGNLWPVTVDQMESVGSWSLNGNHDMYSGGWGYFDTLLTEPRFKYWQSDACGNPSSFFLIEDDNWQIFGLDTSWMLPSLSDTVLGENTWKDYAGQNGALEQGQVEWMQTNRNSKKGCVLLTHHQPSSSRYNELQHSDEAVTRLKAAGLYDQLDTWIWGHEHRGVVFKPTGQRSDPRLLDAPPFCACLGHAGVPVTEKNFDCGQRKKDVEWEEDRIDSNSPLYEGQRIVPYGFATLDSLVGSMEFKMFDHRGEERRAWTIHRRANSR